MGPKCGLSGGKWKGSLELYFGGFSILRNLDFVESSFKNQLALTEVHVVIQMKETN